MSQQELMAAVVLALVVAVIFIIRRNQADTQKNAPPPIEPVTVEPDQISAISMTFIGRAPPSDGIYTVAVVGEGRRNADGTSRQDIICRSCYPGAPIALEREPNNPADQNAVAVRLFATKEQIGYLSRHNAEWIAPLLDDDMIGRVSVNDVHGGTPDRPSIGVTITIQKL